MGGAAGPAYNIGGLHLARAGGDCAVRDWQVPSPVALTDAAYKVCPPPPRPADSSSGMPAECARVVGGRWGWFRGKGTDMPPHAVARPG